MMAKLNVYLEDTIYEGYLRETGKADTENSSKEFDEYMKLIEFVHKDGLFIGLQSKVCDIEGKDIFYYLDTYGETIEICRNADMDANTIGSLAIEKDTIVDSLRKELNKNKLEIFTDEVFNRIMNSDEAFDKIIDEIIDEYTRLFLKTVVKKEIGYKIDTIIKGKLEWK